MSTNNFFIHKPFSKEAIDDLVYLFQLDGKVVSRDYLIRKYLFSNSIENSNYLGCISYDTNGVPAAFVGGTPSKIKDYNRELKGVQIGDVITNPNYRGKGLFISNALHFFEYLRGNTSYDLVFAFPNDNSSPGFFNNMGWHKGYNFQLFTFSNRMINFYGAFHKYTILTPLYTFYKKAVLKFFLRTNKFPFEFNTPDFSVIKNKDFFDYKQRYSDSELIQLFDNYYFIKFIDGLQIDFINIKNAIELKRDLRILSLLLGVKKFSTVHTSNIKIKQILIDAGFVLNRQKEWNTGYLFLHNASRNEEFFFSIADTDEF